MFDFLTDKFSAVFSSFAGQNKLTEKNITDALTQVQDALLEADVPYDIVQEFTKQVHTDVIGQKVVADLKPGEQFIKIVHDKLAAFLQGTAQEVTFKPGIIMVMGLQGAGKTTTIGKLAKRLKKQQGNATMLFASVDYYRPAAIDQLQTLARAVDVDFYRSASDNPVDATRDIINHFHAGSYDYLLFDTAGRLHVDTAMLDELKEVASIAQPDYKMLVLDAMTGQESLNVAQAFDQAVGFTGSVLTKLDSDTRGGAAFAFAYKVGKPILFVGTGEKLDELELFRPDRMAKRIIGMGDLDSLVERANDRIKQAEQDAMTESLAKGTLTLEGFAKQLEMVGKLGSLGKIAQYLPGLGGLKMTPAMIAQGEIQLKQFKAIINSMTPKERLDHTLLNGSRRLRIARGAGLQASDVNQLIARFEQSQQFVRLLHTHAPRGGRFK